MRKVPPLLSPSGTHRSHILAPFLCFCGIASATKLQVQCRWCHVKVTGRPGHHQTNVERLLIGALWNGVHCSTFDSLHVFSYVLTHSTPSIPPTQLFQTISPRNCSVAAFPAMPPIARLGSQRAARHSLAQLRLGRCSQRNPKQTANQLTNIWSSVKMDCNCLVWNWEIVIILAFLKGPCGFI